MTRETYPSDVTDDEWAFIAPYLTLMREDVPQRDHDLREVFLADRFVPSRKCCSQCGSEKEINLEQLFYPSETNYPRFGATL